MFSEIQDYRLSIKNIDGIDNEIEKERYLAYWEEIESVILDHNPSTIIDVTKSLADKTKFGDIDIVIVSPHSNDEDNQEIIDSLGKKVKTYRRVPKDSIDHFTIEMSDGKIVAVDFIRATDKVDFETKKVYYSKYPTSAIIGTMARNLGFLYGKDGFFYPYIDSKGQLHKLMVTNNLRKAMTILNIDPTEFDQLESTNGILETIRKSEFFTPDLFTHKSPKRNEHLKRETPKSNTERSLYEELSQPIKEQKTIQLAKLNCHNNFMDYYPHEYRKVQVEIDNIESQIAKASQERKARVKQRQAQ